MKNIFKLTIAIFAVVIASWIFFDASRPNTPILVEVDADPIQLKSEFESKGDAMIIEPDAMRDDFPLDRAIERVTKKPFGIFISPENSPVTPERFSGYHTGTDFEIFADEEYKDIKVRAICDGKVIYLDYVSGYGGVLIESCELNNQEVTVLYGHLRLTSIQKKVGDSVSKGDSLGVLGRGYSVEADGERKHLHLAIHRGNKIMLRGYVSIKNELASWIDPCGLVC